MTTPPGITSAVRTARATGYRCCVPGTGLPVTEAISRVARKVRDDCVGSLAGNIAFRLMFAFFPTLISILWLLNVIDASRLVRGISDLVDTVVPGVANVPVEEQIQGVPRPQATGEFTFGVIASLVIALWAIAEAFRSVMHAMNVVYAVKDRRSAIRRVLLSVLVSAVTMSLFVAALLLIVFGANLTLSINEWSGLGVSYRWIWWFSAWAVTVGVVLAAFALTYYFAPDVDQRLRWVRTGSLTGVALWLAFTALFAIYVNVISRPTETYGALAGVAFFMLYLYGSSFILLLGAEFNQVIENWEPEGKNDGERVPADGES